ncbi:MAG: serine/threonine-protein kinase [Acidobacteriota bacterium]
MVEPPAKQLGTGALGALGADLPKIPGYKVTGLLGEGGMGRVYLGHQNSTDRRPVAIKMLRTLLPASEMARRFEFERQALSRLNHPAVAQLYGAGHAEDGRHYVAMEYVDGLPIHLHCDRNRLDLRQRLQLFLAVCRGVEHAHRRQLLHRDLKPSNLLIAIPDGEAVPKVIDFGIARTLEDQGGETAFTGAGLLGTPAYMSPEAVGPSDGPRDLDTRADVYSLGVVLYELLVGVRPSRQPRLGRCVGLRKLGVPGQGPPAFKPVVENGRVIERRQSGVRLRRIWII